MILLTDNDVLVKLAQCDLIEEALAVFQCQISDCYVLKEAQHSLYLDDPDKCIGKRLGNQGAYDRLCKLVGDCRKLGVFNEDFDLLEELFEIDGIDAGELALIMHANELNKNGGSYIFTTGDKRALKGIADSSRNIAKKILHQRVECTESIIIKAIGVFGHEYMSRKIALALEATDRNKFDTVLRMSFGNGRDHSHTYACLSGYLRPIEFFIRP